MSKNINSKLHSVSRIEFSITSCLEGCEEKTYIIVDDKVIAHTKRERWKDDFSKTSYVEEMCKESFIFGLTELNLMKWRSDYSPQTFNYPICNTASWFLKIFFSNDHRPVEICGCNNYPRNFEGLMKLFDVKIVEKQ